MIIINVSIGDCPPTIDSGTLSKQGNGNVITNATAPLWGYLMEDILRILPLRNNCTFESGRGTLCRRCCCRFGCSQMQHFRQRFRHPSMARRSQRDHSRKLPLASIVGGSRVPAENSPICPNSGKCCMRGSIRCHH